MPDDEYVEGQKEVQVCDIGGSNMQVQALVLMLVPSTGSHEISVNHEVPLFFRALKNIK